jgi:hypothetical protein
MSKKYTIGMVLPNGLKIIGGPFKGNAERNVKYLVECPICKNSNLKYGNTLSKIKYGCSKCYANALKRTDSLPAVTKAFNSLKSNAKSRNIKVEINLNEFYEIASKNCFWCGNPPQIKYGPKKWQQSVQLSGIDRKHNDIGYTLKNSVACCYDCNRAKSDLSLDLWKFWIIRIVKHNKDWIEKEIKFTS